MKHSRILCAAALSLAFSAVQAQTVTVQERPSIGTTANYAASRAPLQAMPLLKLPVGAVQPKGWLREFLTRQSRGLNGELGTVSAWLEKQNNKWLSGEGDHGWEEVPYWLRGYSSLAYILDDEAMKKEAELWFEAALKSQRPDGFFGPVTHEGEYVDYWAQMIMLWALQTYYEHTADERVITAMSRYCHHLLTLTDDEFLTHGYWQHHRGGDNLWSVIWLYNLTGDESLLPLIDKIHRCTSDWTQSNTLPNWHGVNIAQGFREPATYYLYTGDKRHLYATYNNFDIMHERYGQMPGGMYAADENARAGYFDPRNGAETCAIVEHMVSDEILMGITADPFWADHCENVAFNSFAAALMPDMRSLRYITSANMAISDEKLHGPSIDNNLRGMLSMSPFSSRCCQHNHGMGWPYYAEHLVMATTDGGLCAMLYAESETTAKVADGREVRLVEETHYPFDGEIAFTLRTAGPVEFPLYLRIPAWAAGASALVNGKPVEMVAAEGKYVRILRRWKDGDQIALSLPMNISTDVWQQNKASVSVNYGALTLSLRIDEEIEQHDSRDHSFVQDDSHWQQGVDASLWPCYVLKPKSDWNYALELGPDMLPLDFEVVKKPWPADNFPFTLESVPLEFKAVGRRIPTWGYDQTGMTDFLPTRYAERSSENYPITLVPMGAARLRIAAFPKASSAWR